MEDVTANKRKMKELEDNLLFRLTSTQVMLLCFRKIVAMFCSAVLSFEDEGAFSC